MRRMSFALTERQLLAGHKTVTRRLGWAFLKPGDELLAVRKCMGLKKGEKQHPLAVIRITDVRVEPLLLAALPEEPRLEGFPWMTGTEFVDFFCHSQGCEQMQDVTRIEFEIVRLL
jgi:hypothetical protein